MTDKDNIYIEIGKRVQQIRIERRFTQARLAEIVEMTRTSITNIEKGRQKILVHTLYDLAGALGIDPADLLPAPTSKIGTGSDTRLPENLSNKELTWLKSVLKGASHGTSKKSH